MQAETIRAGQWYHTVDCTRCGSAIHAFHARAGEGEKLPGPGMFAVRCIDCGYRDLYKPTIFQVRRAADNRGKQVSAGKLVGSRRKSHAAARSV